jgi:hypothetical protein
MKSLAVGRAIANIGEGKKKRRTYQHAYWPGYLVAGLEFRAQQPAMPVWPLPPPKHAIIGYARRLMPMRRSNVSAYGALKQ